MSFIKGGSTVKRKAALPPAVAVAAASGGSGNSSTGNSQGSSEYISEDEHIQHLDQSGALNQVAGSQSILSQELQQHHRHHQQHFDLPAGGDEETESNHDSGDLSQISNLDMGGFSQSSTIDCHIYGEESQASETVFNSQKAARKYGLLSQDPFALPARSLTEPPLSQRSTASAITISNHSLLPPSGSQGSSNNSSAESNFGSLLDAVQLFQSQEAEEERLQLSQETASSSHDREDREEGCDDNGNDGGSDRGYDPTVRTNKKKKSEQPSSPGEENIYRSRALTFATAANKMSGSDNRSQKSNLAPGATCTASRNNGNSSNPRKPTLPFAKKKVIGNRPMVAKKQPPHAVAPATPTTPIKNSAMSSNRNVGAPAVTHQTMTPAPPKVAPIANVTRVTDKTPTSDGSKKRKRKNDSEIVKQQKLAERAAALAQRTINDADLAKRLLLSMALTRENPRSAPEKLPGPGFSLPAGFFWAHYPPLEKVLKDNMAEYYELSVTKCQSAQQQSFNNTLVQLVRAESNRQQWLFDPVFTDKSLRDRIRCYYKTHIQNAKKRLRTMVKNPTKRANARHLCAHLDMIENNVENNAADKTSACSLGQTTIPTNGSDVIEHSDWGAGIAGGTP